MTSRVRGCRMVGAGGFEPPNGRSKVSWLTTCRRPKTLELQDVADQAGLLRPLPLIFVEDSVLDEFSRVVVDRMGHVLVGPVRSLPARHGHEHPVRPLDDLETTDDERVVEGHAGEGLELIVVPERYPHFCDLECHTVSPTSSSGLRSLGVPGPPNQDSGHARPTLLRACGLR